jgi:hypothetical protein
VVTSPLHILSARSITVPMKMPPSLSNGRPAFYCRIEEPCIASTLTDRPVSKRE